PLAPGKLKTTMCKFYSFGTCTKGENCAYAHSESEIGTPMPGRNGQSSSGFMREGDWMCECGNHNFASRIRCNSCDKMKDGKKPGDWMCSNCRAENEAAAESCTKCQSSKESANLTSKMEMMTASKGDRRPRSSPYGKGGGGMGWGEMGGYGPMGGCAGGMGCDGMACGNGCGMGGCGGDGWWDEWSAWGWGDDAYRPEHGMVPMGGKGGSGKGGGPTPPAQSRAGDWTCECGNINFESRVKCNRHSCAKMKPGFVEGDWICRKRECRQHNNIAHEVCQSCSAPRGQDFRSAFP
ncbi:unnamed protein product, partial [Durusdinium trenchii]